MNDLDRFTTGQLTAMSEQASRTAITHYSRATVILTAAARIPYDDKKSWDLAQQQWQAAIAAGNEQEELCRAIGDEIRMRAVCDA